MSSSIVKDIVQVRLHNSHKLFTKEDPGNFHKILGFVALVHFIYRFYLYFRYDTMGFDDSWWTPVAIFMHSLLSVSSMLFKIPERRIQSGPMIYPELRLHTIFFSLRSTFTMLFLYLVRVNGWTQLLYLRGLIILGTMYAADYVTAMYKDQGTTIRAVPFPDYVEPWQRDAINFYYSVSQLIATAQVIFSDSLEPMFVILFPIQIAAFLQTCVRKSIITTGASHYYYSLALGVGHIFGAFYAQSSKRPARKGGFCVPVLLVVCLLRFSGRSANKYLIWSGAILTHIAAMYFFDKYDTIVI